MEVPLFTPRPVRELTIRLGYDSLKASCGLVKRFGCLLCRKSCRQELQMTKSDEQAEDVGRLVKGSPKVSQGPQVLSRVLTFISVGLHRFVKAEFVPTEASYQ
jgi:hypothetical protein